MKKIGIIKGDGIGPEISKSVIEIINSLDLDLEWIEIQLGEKNLSLNKDLLPKEELKKIKDCDAVLKAPLNTPIGKGFSSVNVALRKEFDLHINYRPAKTYGNFSKFNNVDLITIRENLQGMYSGLDQVRTENYAEAKSYMSKDKLILFFEESFNLAKKLKRKKITIVHKANILKSTSGLFLDTALEVSKNYPDLIFETMIVDACAMNLVKNPNNFDVIVTSNLFGDILSDLCAGLVGGLGLAPGANINDKTRIYEAVHGTAPDIAGKDLANPTAFLLSAALMLDDLSYHKEKIILENAIIQALKDPKTRTGDLDGTLGTQAFTDIIIKLMRKGREGNE